MAEENETGFEQDMPATSENVAPRTPYVRERPAHRSVDPIDDYAQDGESSESFAHDSGYTMRGSLVSGGSYRRSRSDADKLRRDLHYGQYLEIPKGRRDIFVKRERINRVKTFFALVAVLAILAAAVYFVWQYMQTNWGATS